MDVRCSRCATEYEFDDTKVVGAGVTVKCSSCGHVFKVSASGTSSTTTLPDGTPSPSSTFSGGVGAIGQANAEWIVRKGDGTTTTFKELTTLQKWIVEQRVSRLDEISRTGNSWKRLGDIAELASFFQVVDAANIAASQPTMQHVGVPQANPSPLSTMQPSDNVMGGAGPSPTMTTGEQGEFFDANSTLADLEDDDPVLAWRRRNRMRNFAIVMSIVVVTAVAVAFFAFPKETKATLSPLLAKVGMQWPASEDDKQEQQLLAEVHQVLLADDDEKVRTLKNRLEEKEVAQGENAKHLAAVALVHAALALHAEERARLMALLGQTTRATQTALDDKARSVKRADILAARARRISPDLGRAFVANAWVRAIRGESSEMAADLDVAMSLSQQDTSVVAESRALKAIASAKLTLISSSPDQETSAHQALALAIKAAPDDKRLRYYSAALRVEAALHGKPALSQEEKDALVVDVTALGSSSPTHRAALLLLRLNPESFAGSKLDDTIPKNVKRTENKADGPKDVVSNVDAKVDAKADASNGGAKVEEGSKEIIKEIVLSDAAYASLLKRANRARVGDKSRTALKLYRQASAAKPSDAKPYVGMGWSYLDLGRAQKAVKAFRAATRKAPSLPVAHFGLAEAQTLAGNPTSAAASYDVVLRLDPNGPDSADARRALKRLR